MLKSILFIGLLLVACGAQAQHVGVNQPTPVQPLHVTGTTRLDSALVLHPATSLAPADAIALPSRVTTLIIGADASTTLNALTPPTMPIEGQVLYIANTDDDPATFVGTTIAPTNGFNHYLYLGGQWRLISKQPASGSGWGLEGNAATVPGVGVGQNYLGTTDAQAFVIATNATSRLNISASGAIQMFGDFINQDLKGLVRTIGSAAITAPTSQTYAALGLPTLTGYCPSCLPADYGYTSPNVGFSGLNSVGHLIEGCNGSITVEGSGVENSGVLIMANVVVKSTTTGTVAAAGRYIIFLQRDTDPAFSAPVTLYKVEDMASAAAAGTNPVAGAATTTIVYPDLGLAPGTYYYRLVYSGLSGASNGQTLGVADRSFVLLQVKR